MPARTVPDSPTTRRVSIASIGDRSKIDTPEASQALASPAVTEAETLELREGFEEVAGQEFVAFRALFVVRTHAVVPVVVRVVAAPQNAIVGRESVVVELIAGISEPFATRPADVGHLCSREGLGHQDVVVHRDDVATHLSERLGPCVGCNDDALCVDRTVIGADSDPLFIGVDLGHARVVVDHAAHALDGAPKSPGEAGRIDERDVGAGEPTQIGG